MIEALVKLDLLVFRRVLGLRREFIIEAQNCPLNREF